MTVVCFGAVARVIARVVNIRDFHFIKQLCGRQILARVDSGIVLFQPNFEELSVYSYPSRYVIEAPREVSVY